MGKKLGSYVKEKRTLTGLSQRSIAERLTPPVTTQFVSRIENGASSIPAERILGLAALLQVPVNELVDFMADEYKEWLKVSIGLQSGEVTS